ncbi:TMV resistance protein N-like [Trifolium medium]|uniref:TMV resistance protein N-like n=1 Tax=Trifolium medium TaxID=97028 RepID=A0A392M2P9_9FABA|nr:TMV resistance protein N-like [Trifolium medium]
MFSNHFAQYDSACFLENVREEVEKFGLRYIRNKLFSALLKREITASDILGATFIERMLSGRKVFIVLDDVGNAAQLEYLCEELDDLDPNSRLIVTARDRHTLRRKVDEIYEVTAWDFEKSLRIFSLAAFKQNHPKDGYKLLSQRAVVYAGGIPLALKVLGSHFYSRNLEFWEPELKYLETKGESLHEILEVLKVSYNGLTAREKEIFLDIAFFFKDEHREFVKRILDAYGFNATSGIDILKDKALITISNFGGIQMHDLLQEMAFDIVRQKKDRTSRDPGKRSRLRNIEDVCDVFKNSKGTHKVEGITLDLSEKRDLHVKADTFNMMTKLKFLRLYVPLNKNRSATIYHSEDMMPFSDKLRCLEWNGCPFHNLFVLSYLLRFTCRIAV